MVAPSLLVVVPSLVIPTTAPPRASVCLATAVADPPSTVESWYDAGIRLDGAAAPEVVAAVADDAPAPVGSTEEQIRSLVSSDAIQLQSTEAFSKLREIEKESGGIKDPAAVKDQLVGAWKLAAASDGFYGVTGNADKSYTKPLGHVQYFRKPDPMDIFSGNKDKLFFMETVEVIGNAKLGATTTAAIKGGFSISPDLEFPVVESYTKSELDGRVVSEEGMVLNTWQCVYLSERMRVCRTKGGAFRVYDKVDADAAAAEVARLAATTIEIDPEALLEDAVPEEEEEYDDPNIPEWQKRIDKLDGTKRTANGTPIVNHGPNRFGGGGGPQQRG